MKCNQCQTEMVSDCQVSVEGDLSGIKISKKGKGFFKKVTAKTKAAVCPNCGFVSFYVEDYKDFK
jgi:ssDNA-binding Zn-finger/Zn-ribbon topoisomerase 1